MVKVFRPWRFFFFKRCDLSYFCCTNGKHSYYFEFDRCACLNRIWNNEMVSLSTMEISEITDIWDNRIKNMIFRVWVISLSTCGNWIFDNYTDFNWSNHCNKWWKNIGLDRDSNPGPQETVPAPYYWATEPHVDLPHDISPNTCTLPLSYRTARWSASWYITKYLPLTTQLYICICLWDRLVYDILPRHVKIRPWILQLLN